MLPTPPAQGPAHGRIQPASASLRVGVADPSQRFAIAALRRAAYRAAAQFEWNDESTLDWSAADDSATVLAVWNAAGVLLSTIRASVFCGAETAESFLEYSLAGIKVPGPTLVLSRAATAPAAAHHGLFAWLRYAYLSALSATRIQSVVAIVYEGAPHSGLMRECGYQFFEPESAWDSEAVARTRPLVAVLPRARFEHALRLRHAALMAACGQHPDGVQIDSAGIAAALRAGCAALDSGGCNSR